jgi:hypothetical protein
MTSMDADAIELRKQSDRLNLPWHDTQYITDDDSGHRFDEHQVPHTSFQQSSASQSTSHSETSSAHPAKKKR